MAFYVINYFRCAKNPLLFSKICNICILHSRKKHSSKSVCMKNNFKFQKNYQEKLHKNVTTQTNDKLVSGNLLENASEFVGQEQKKRRNVAQLRYRGEILFGVHSVYLALLERKRKFHRLFVRKGSNSNSDDSANSLRRNKIIEMASNMNIPVNLIDSRGLKYLAPDAVHQGICLDAGPLPILDWEESRLQPQITEDSLWLVIDEILDPMNVGAIIRSAYYFGVRELFITKGYSCKLSPAVSKASSGCLEVMTAYQIGNLDAFIKGRKNCGWNVISTVAYSENKECMQKQTDATEFQITGPSILILGNEGRGISASIQKLCDSFVSIHPNKALQEGIDSLNVSVAAGIILYSLSKASRVKKN